MPRGETLTSITVRDQQIVTRAELQDIEGQNSSSSNNQSDQRIFIDIQTDMVQKIKKQYYSHDLNSIYNDDDAPPDVDLQNVEGIDLRNDTVERQSPWEMNEQAYGNAE